MEQPSLENFPPLFRAESGATPYIISALSMDIQANSKKLIDGWLENSTEWANSIDEIRSRIQKITTESKLAIGTNNSIVGFMENLVEFGSVSSPAPLSYALYVVQQSLKAKRVLVESAITQSLAKKSRKLTERILSKLIDDSGQPYASLFPAANTAESVKNIAIAREMLENELDDIDPKIRSLVLDSMVQSLQALIRSGKSPSRSNYNSDTIKSDASGVSESVKACELVSSEMKNSSELIKQRIEETSDNLKGKIKSLDDAEQKKIKLVSALNAILDAGSVSPAVLDAAVTLGFDPEAAAMIQTAVDGAMNLAGLILGIKSNPILAIQSGAQLINMFGNKADPDAERHKQIMETLRFLAKQNQTILENQRIILANQNTIIDGIAAINFNQANIIGFTRRSIDEVLLNREFLIAMSTGPIYFMDKYVLGKSEEFDYTYLKSLRLNYNDVVELFDSTGDQINAGLTQLELLFQSTNDIHPVLKLRSYASSDIVTTSLTGQQFTKFEIDRSSIQYSVSERLELFNLKLLEFEKRNLPIRMLTEYASYDLLFSRADPFDIKGNWFLQDELQSEYINPGVLIRLAIITIKSHFLFQFLTANTGLLTLKTKEVLLDEEKCNNRGLFILENVLSIVNQSISQQYLMTENNDYEILSELLNGEFSITTCAKWHYSSSYKTELRGLEIIEWIWVYVACQLGDESPELHWFERFHEFYLEQDHLHELHSAVEYEQLQHEDLYGPTESMKELDNIIAKAREKLVEIFTICKIDDKVFEELTLDLSYSDSAYHWSIKTKPYALTVTDLSPNSVLSEAEKERQIRLYKVHEELQSIFKGLKVDISTINSDEYHTGVREVNVDGNSVKLAFWNYKYYGFSIMVPRPPHQLERKASLLFPLVKIEQEGLGLSTAIVESRFEKETFSASIRAFGGLNYGNSTPIINKLLEVKSLLIDEVAGYSQDENNKELWNLSIIASSYRNTG